MAEVTFHLLAAVESDDGKPLFVGVGGEESVWTEAEYDQIQQDISRVVGFGRSQTYDVLRSAYMGFAQLVRAVEEAWISDQRRPEAEITGVVMFLYVYLTAMRSFLDQTDRRLKHRYGPDSEQRALFERATNEAYDGSFAYRFLDWLRNHAQHYDVPLSRILVNEHLEHDGHDEVVVRSVLIGIDTGRILTAPKANLKAVLRRDLESRRPDFSIAPVVADGMDHMNDLVLLLARLEAVWTIAKADELVELVRPAIDEGGAPFIMRTASGGTQPENMTPINVQGILDAQRRALHCIVRP